MRTGAAVLAIASVAPSTMTSIFGAIRTAIVCRRGAVVESTLHGQH